LHETTWLVIACHEQQTCLVAQRRSDPPLINVEALDDDLSDVDQRLIKLKLYSEEVSLKTVDEQDV
jgi:hypothetical protein